MIEAPDILVVGLGPAGSRAAATAAAAGLNVVALERRKTAGTPVQCAEFVPAPIEQDVPNVRAVTEQKVTRMLTFVAARQPEVTEHFHGLMIDRGAFDRMLAHEAAWNGADCRYGETVLSIDADGTVTTSAGARLLPRVLIGAEGPHSRVGAAIGAVNRDLVDTRQVTVPLVLPHEATDIFLSADYRGGYAWLFPKGAVGNVGLGVSIEFAKIAQAAARCALHKACRRASHWDEGICPHGRRHSGRRPPALNRTPRAYRRAASRRRRRPDEPCDWRGHRLRSAVGRPRRARSGRFCCRSHVRA